MRLTDLAGPVLELEIVGYQFPDESSREAARERAAKHGLHVIMAAPNKDDSNWLVVRGHVETANGPWDFLDPCLETWEARSLSGWLEAASSGEACGRIDFIEPNIGFESAMPEPDGTVKVIASFALEARPPWADKDDFETLVDFVFTRQELAAAASALGRNLDLFPER